MNSKFKKKNSFTLSTRLQKKDNKYSRESREKNLMNKFFLNNRELLNNYRKKQSKTPNKLRKQSPVFVVKNINTAKNSYLNKQNLINNHSQVPLYNNQPISLYNNNNFFKNNKLSRSKSNSKQRPIKSNNKNTQKIIKNNKSHNILSRSESFSILKSNYFLENNNSNKENHINRSMNIVNEKPKDIKRNKLIKKIYKIESICQVGYSGPGIIKYNQDNFFVYNNLNDENDVLFIGVCDGHGLLGHDVSKYLITNLPSNLNKALKKTRKYIRDKKTLNKTMKEVFIKTNDDLCKDYSVDTQFSLVVQHV